MKKPISKLRNVTGHIESHSVTCHPTQVNASRFNSRQTSEEWKAEFTSVLVKYQDGLPVRKESPIEVVIT